VLAEHRIYYLIHGMINQDQITELNLGKLTEFINTRPASLAFFNNQETHHGKRNYRLPSSNLYKRQEKL